MTLSNQCTAPGRSEPSQARGHPSHESLQIGDDQKKLTTMQNSEMLIVGDGETSDEISTPPLSPGRNELGKELHPQLVSTRFVEPGESSPPVIDSRGDQIGVYLNPDLVSKRMKDSKSKSSVNVSENPIDSLNSQLVSKRDFSEPGKETPDCADSFKAKRQRVLKITVYSADNIPKTDMLSETDPFVMLKLGNKDFRTATLDNAGRNPIWREEFVFSAELARKDLVVSIHDDDLVSSGLIGKLTLSLDDVLAPLQAAAGDQRAPVDRFFELQEGAMGRDKLSRPRIRLIFEYIPLTEVRVRRRRRRRRRRGPTGAVPSQTTQFDTLQQSTAPSAQTAYRPGPYPGHGPPGSHASCAVRPRPRPPPPTAAAAAGYRPEFHWARAAIFSGCHPGSGDRRDGAERASIAAAAARPPSRFRGSRRRFSRGTRGPRGMRGSLAGCGTRGPGNQSS